MNPLLSFITAALTGGCVGISFWLFCRMVAQIKLEKSQELAKSVPVLFRMSMPFLPMVRPLAQRPLFAQMLESDTARLQMAGYDEVIPALDMVGLRIIFFIDALVLLFIGAFGGHMMMCLIVAMLFIFFSSILT